MSQDFPCACQSISPPQMTVTKLAWDYVDEADEFVMLMPAYDAAVSPELKAHIVNEKLKISEGLRYLSERAEMERAMRRMDRDRRANRKLRGHL
jgi:hypothetical protein